MKVLVSLVFLVFGLGLNGPPAQAEVIGEHGDWTVFKTVSDGGPVCFSGSVPVKDEGDYTKRGDIYVLVTHRAKTRVADVVSIEAGYNYRADSDVSVKIGAQTISMFTNGSNAWARDEATDRKLIAAMKRGTTMVVHGTSWRGTATRDTYSLTGFTAAYNTARKACNL